KNLEQIVTLLISIHALTRSATFRLLKPFLTLSTFQSTHSRGVRPHHYSYQNEIDHISIHALTRSATSLLFLLLLVVYISIHALTRSATSKRYFYRSG